MTYISWSSDFALYLEDYLIYELNTSGIMCQYDTTFDLKINVGHCDIFHGLMIFALYLELEDHLMYEHHSLGL